MSKYDILVADAKLNLDLAKRKLSALNDMRDKIFNRMDNIEIKLNNATDKILEQESYVRSLASKLSWAKRKNK